MSMFATLGQMLSPRLSPRCDGSEGNASSGTAGAPQRKTATLRDFGSMLPRPGNQQSPAAPGFRSPRGLDQRSPRTSTSGAGAEQQRAPRRSTGGYAGATPASGSSAPLSARLRERGGVTRDGRDAYDIWYGVSSSEKKPVKSSRRSSTGSTNMGTKKTPEEIRDGFEMFYGIDEESKSEKGVTPSAAVPAAARAPQSARVFAAPQSAVPAAPRVFHASEGAPLAQQAASAIATAAAAVSASVTDAMQQLQPSATAAAPGTDASREEWLRQVKAIEAQLQATIAAGPDGAGGSTATTAGQRSAPAASPRIPGVASTAVPVVKPPVFRVMPPVEAASVEEGQNQLGHDGQDSQDSHPAAPVAQVFSVSTPSAPAPPASVVAAANTAAANNAKKATTVATPEKAQPTKSTPCSPVPCLNLSKVNSPVS